MKMDTPENRLLHIDYMPDIGWVYPIWNKLNSIIGDPDEMIKRIESAGLDNLSVSIATKLKMLTVCAKRIRKNRLKLNKELIANKDKAYKSADKGHAYPLKDKEFPYEILLDLEMFILLTRSTYEITGKFIRIFFKKILNKKISEIELVAILKSKNIDTKWIEESKDNRILFFHNSASWLGIVLPYQFIELNELVLFKKKDIDLTNNEDYISMSDLFEIYKNFVESIINIRDWIITEIDEFGKTI